MDIRPSDAELFFTIFFRALGRLCVRAHGAFGFNRHQSGLCERDFLPLPAENFPAGIFLSLTILGTLHYFPPIGCIWGSQPGGLARLWL